MPPIATKLCEAAKCTLGANSRHPPASVATLAARGPQLLGAMRIGYKLGALQRWPRGDRHGKTNRPFLPRHPHHRSAFDQDCGRDRRRWSSADLPDRGSHKAQRLRGVGAGNHGARLSQTRQRELSVR